MACTRPLRAYRGRGRTKNGRVPIVFDRKSSRDGVPVDLPCGRCIGCRLEKSRQWAVRSLHELESHEEASFITLTYDDDHLPVPPQVDVREIQLFMKRIRKRTGRKLRYIAVGEYGSRNLRPHYHLVVFGYWPSDAMRYGEYWMSAELDDVWQNRGMVVVGEVTFDSAAYVARYTAKKYMADDRWLEMLGMNKPFIVMSRRPGIGRYHFERFIDEYREKGTTVINGREVVMPRYYDRLLSETDLMRLKGERKKRAKSRDLFDLSKVERLMESLLKERT